jgi:hypothetical protein
MTTTTHTPAEILLAYSIALVKDGENAITRYRKTLAAKVEQGRGAEDLSSLCHDIARHEAAVGVFTRVAQTLDAAPADYDLAIIDEMLFGIATWGSDDTWSGRGNDLRRSMADGRIHAVTVLHGKIDALRHP